MNLRIIDRRLCPDGSRSPASVQRRPWEVQYLRGGHWTTVLACWYASVEEAEQGQAKVARLLEESQ